MDDLYKTAMTLRSHADGSGGGLELGDLELLATTLQTRIDAWGRSRSLSEEHFKAFLTAVLVEYRVVYPAGVTRG